MARRKPSARTRDDAATSAGTTSASGSLVDRPLWDALVGDQVTISEDALARADGALNLLRRAERLLTDDPGEGTDRALALIERAAARLDGMPDLARSRDLREHVAHIRELAQRLRDRAAVPDESPPAPSGKTKPRVTP